MKHLQHIAFLAAIALFAAACTDDATESSGVPDRLFRPVNVEVSAAGNTFSAMWAAIDGAESYVAELYVRRAVEDAEGNKYDDRELVLRDDHVVATTWSVPGLEYATQYYFRVRANHPDLRMNSHFTVFYGIKTPAEIMVLDYVIDDPVQGTVTFTWMSGYELTYIHLEAADGTETRFDIDDAAGSLTVDRLAAGSYTAYAGNENERFNTLSILIPVLYEVAPEDISYEGVTLRWSPDSNIDHIELMRPDPVTGEAQIKTFPASPDGVLFIPAAEMEYFATYLATLVYADESRSNSVTFTTKDRKPEGMVVVSTTEELKNAILTAVDGSTIGLNPGTYESLMGEEEKGLMISKSMTVIPATGVTPVVYVTKAFDINSAAMSELRFEGIDFRSDANSYFINVTPGNSFTLQNFTVKDCSFTGFGRSIIRTQSNGQKVGAITIENCVVKGQQESGQNYAVVHLQNNIAAELPATVTILNSTFDGMHSLIQYSKMSDKSLTPTADVSTAVVSHCTFYDICTPGQSGRYFVDMSENMDSRLQMESCVLAKVNADTYKGVRSKSATTTGVYMTSDMSFSANKLPDALTVDKGAEDVFADPAAGDFTLVSGTELETNKVGDPRWYTE